MNITTYGRRFARVAVVTSLAVVAMAGVTAAEHGTDDPGPLPTVEPDNTGLAPIDECAVLTAEEADGEAWRTEQLAYVRGRAATDPEEQAMASFAFATPTDVGGLAAIGTEQRVTSVAIELPFTGNTTLKVYLPIPEGATIEQALLEGGARVAADLNAAVRDAPQDAAVIGGTQAVLLAGPAGYPVVGVELQASWRHLARFLDESGIPVYSASVDGDTPAVLPPDAASRARREAACR